MKIPLSAILLCIAPASTLIFVQGCVVTEAQKVHSIQAMGESAKATLDGAAFLYVKGKITKEQWTTIADFYDNKFQPAFRLLLASQNSGRKEEVAALLVRFTNLVASYDTGNTR